MKHLYLYLLYSWWLEGSLCGAQIPQKVPGYIQSSYCKFVNYKFMKILICYYYVNSNTVIFRLSSIYFLF